MPRMTSPATTRLSFGMFCWNYDIRLRWCQPIRVRSNMLSTDSVTPAVFTIGAGKVAAGLLYRERDGAGS